MHYNFSSCRVYLQTKKIQYLHWFDKEQYTNIVKNELFEFYNFIMNPGTLVIFV